MGNATNSSGLYSLDGVELKRRENFVGKVDGYMKEIKSKLAGTHTKLPKAADQGAFEEDEAGDGYAGMEQQRQVEIMQEQDEALDDVYRTVGNLREQADTMGRELEEQGGMLEEVDTLADKVGGKLQGGMQKLNHIIRRNEGECDYAR